MPTDLALETVRRCYQAIDARDLDDFVALLADNCVMVEIGAPDVPHAGVYRGAVEITGVFRRLSELSQGTGRFELQDLYSDGNGAVVAVHRNLARRPDGRTLDTREALLFEVRHGRVSSIRNFYSDVDEVARFWSS